MEVFLRKRMSEGKFAQHQTLGVIQSFLQSDDLKALRENTSNEQHIRDWSNIKKAAALAVRLHMSQADRATGVPFIHHIFAVAARLVSKFEVQDANLIIGALLHDVIEDQSRIVGTMSLSPDISVHRGRALAYLHKAFGERVAQIVESLTNDEYPETMSKADKNAKYAGRIKEVIQDPDVALIKLSDFYENALCLNDLTDVERRYWQAKKYLPVAGYFIDRLRDTSDPRVPMSEDRRQKTIGDLEKARDEMREFISAHESEMSSKLNLYNK
jgi:(p)ppGpp synthase/HD superfamily hydrolase